MRHLLRIQQGLSSYKTQAQESLFPHFLTFAVLSYDRIVRRTERFAKYQNVLLDVLWQNRRLFVFGSKSFSDEQKTEPPLFRKLCLKTKVCAFALFSLFTLVHSFLFFAIYKLNCLCNYMSSYNRSIGQFVRSNMRRVRNYQSDLVLSVGWHRRREPTCDIVWHFVTDMCARSSAQYATGT